MTGPESITGHVIVPKPGTVRTPTGKPASLLRPMDYPVVAECMECGQPVRCERYFLADWYHIDHS